VGPRRRREERDWAGGLRGPTRQLVKRDPARARGARGAGRGGARGAGLGHVLRPRRRALAERSGDGPARRGHTEKAKKNSKASPGRVSVEGNAEWVGSGVLARDATNRAERKGEPTTIKTSWHNAGVDALDTWFTPICRDRRFSTKPRRAPSVRES
jgi:hypothetical protein